jgi:hypothetical protein
MVQKIALYLWVEIPNLPWVHGCNPTRVCTFFMDHSNYIRWLNYQVTKMQKEQIDWEIISLRVPEGVKQEYRQLCKAQASSVSQMTRALIETYMITQKQSNA